MIAGTEGPGLVPSRSVVAASGVATVPTGDTTGAYLPGQGCPTRAASVPCAVAYTAPDHACACLAGELGDKATTSGLRPCATAHEPTEDATRFRHELTAVLAQKRHARRHFLAAHAPPSSLSRIEGGEGREARVAFHTRRLSS